MQKKELSQCAQKALPIGIVSCFFLSGAVSLVYQTLWVRMFTVVFGNSSYAVSTVLSAFMAGLCLGSWYFGKKLDRIPARGLLLYAILEMGIAAGALLLPAALRVVDAVHVILYGYLLGSNYLLMLTRFVLAFVILLVPTTLMGGTLPILSDFFVRRRDRISSGVGSLYAANTIGAVGGCFLSGFYLIGILGVSSTLKWTIIANLGVGAAACALSLIAKRFPQTDEVQPASQFPACAQPCSESYQDCSSGHGRLLLLFAALAGGTGLAYEVLWSRVLVFYINNSTYAFTAMLTVLLFGIAAGGYLFGKLGDKQRNLWLWFAIFQFGIAIWNFLAFPVLDTVFHKLPEISTLFEADFWGAPVYITMIKSALLLLIPTLLMGACFPLLARLFSLQIGKISRGVGEVYSKNTFGSMAGAFAAGFILIPLLGLQKSMIATALVNIALALAAVWISDLRKRPRAFLITAMCLTAAAAVFVTPKSMFFRRHDENWTKLVFYKEDNTATVKVYDTPGEMRVISINGYEVAGARVSLHEIQKALGHYPALLQKNPQTALVIGFGAGGTCAALAQHGLSRIDLVEIVPAVLEAAPYLSKVNNGVLENPIVHPVIDDGMNFVHAIQRTYDIISVDSIDPKHAGNGSLYTTDFYSDCLSKLNPDGIMVQWIPYHLLTDQELKIILNSFSQVFPHHNLWFTPLFNYFILAGSPNEIVADYAAIASHFNDPEIRKDLALINLKSSAAFISTLAMDEARIAAYVGNSRPRLNSFDHPRIEFFGKYQYSTFGQLPITSLCENIKIKNLGSTEQEQEQALGDIERQRLIARNMAKGAFYLTRKAYAEAAQYWQAALSVDPYNSGARYMLRATARSLNHEMSRNIALFKEHPEDPMAYFRMALFLESINKWKEAVPLYLFAIRLKPEFEQAHTNLGLLYLRAGNPDKALETFQTALDINPAALAAAHNAGMILYLKGDYVQARTICMKALAKPAITGDRQLRMKIQEILRLTELASSNEAKPS